MTIVSELVLERQWTWDDALYEVTYIRAERMSLLQPRPGLLKAPNGSKSTNHPAKELPPLPGLDLILKVPQRPKGGKSKTKGKVAWVTETMIKGERKQLRMRFQSNKCTLGDFCKFHHGCAFLVGDGHACGKQHGALQHSSTPHGQSTSIGAGQKDRCQDHVLVSPAIGLQDQQLPQSSDGQVDEIPVAPVVSPSTLNEELPATPVSQDVAPGKKRMLLDVCCGHHI